MLKGRSQSTRGAAHTRKCVEQYKAFNKGEWGGARRGVPMAAMDSSVTPPEASSRMLHQHKDQEGYGPSLREGAGEVGITI